MTYSLDSLLVVRRGPQVLGLLLLGCNFDAGSLGTATSGAPTTSGSTGDPMTVPTTGSVDTTAGTQSGSATTTDGTSDSMSTGSGSTETSTSTTSESTSTTTSSESSSSDGGMSGSSSTGMMDDCTPIVVEALTALSGSDGSREWIVLHNPCPADYDMTGLSLAWGNNGGYYGGVDLTGMLAAGDCFVIGGPTSDGSNFDPVYDQTLDFPGGLDGNEGAIGLFELLATDVDVTDTPVDVVIYGPGNTAGYLDPMGAMPAVMVGDPPDNQSLARTSLDATWQLGNPPTPNDCPGF